MSLPQENRSYILKLPNEVLSDILSNVILTSSGLVFWHESKISDSRFYSVRATCRQFRAIVAELPFWRQPDFDILTFKPISYKSDRGYEHAEFFRNLFTDGGVVRMLQLRTDWDVITVKMFKTLMDGLPLFRENVRSMKLYLDDQLGIRIPVPLTDAMSLLGKCHSLTSLVLLHHGRRSTLNFDDLSQSLPSLETLHIHCMLNLTTGSVALKHLREMIFLGGDAIVRYGKNTRKVLPIHSALTLQNLSLRRWPLIKGLYNHTALDCFVNLTLLDVEPLNRSLCKLLMQFPGRLTTLKTGTDPISSDRSREAPRAIAQAFSSPCLQNLKSLTFYLEFKMPARHIYPQMIEPIIDKITKITAIQDLDLNMSLDLHWHPYFSRMINLKRLKWETEDNFDLDPTYHSLGIDMMEATPIRLSHEKPDKKVKNVFSKALENLPVMPELDFEIKRMDYPYSPDAYVFGGEDYPYYDPEPDEDSEESDQWIESDDEEETDDDNDDI
jgi:hypothetical protein